MDPVPPLVRMTEELGGGGRDSPIFPFFTVLQVTPRDSEPESHADLLLPNDIPT